MAGTDTSSESRSLIRRLVIAAVFLSLALLLAVFGVASAQALARRLKG
jgi:hypothetical protein